MDNATIVSLIGSLGFPIVAAVGLFWNQVTNMKEFREAMNKNTAALQELILLIKTSNERNNLRVIEPKEKE